MDIPKHIKNKFLAGLFILIPLLVTVYVIYFIISSLDGIILPLMQKVTKSLTGKTFYIPGAGIVLFVLIAYFTGVFASNFIGKRLLVYGEQVLGKIPIVKSIYSSVKDMTDAFSSEKVKSFKEVVLIEFPYPGRYAYGFVTRRDTTGDGTMVCSVFVPTTPNPTSGYLIVAKEEDLVFLNIPIDDAIKHIISLGASRVKIEWKDLKLSS